MLQADAFAVSAMRELQQIYSLKGERELADNLGRHIRTAEARMNKKRAGKVHGSTAWEQMMSDVRTDEQRELVSAARQRKVELGMIRPQPPQQQASWMAGQHAQQQQPQQQVPQQLQQQHRAGRGRNSKQQQQVQEVDGLAGFDFSTAVQSVQSEAAAAHRAPGRRRRQSLQQQEQQQQ